MSQILLVDDAPDILDFLGASLTLSGHKVTACSNGPQALQVFERSRLPGATPFDLIVCDLAMPGVNGFEVAEKVFEMDSAAKLVFLTAFDEPISVGRAERTGALAIWSKPVSKDELELKVAAVLAAFWVRVTREK